MMGISESFLKFSETSPDKNDKRIVFQATEKFQNKKRSILSPLTAYQECRSEVMTK